MDWTIIDHYIDQVLEEFIYNRELTILKASALRQRVDENRGMIINEVFKKDYSTEVEEFIYQWIRRIFKTFGNKIE